MLRTNEALTREQLQQLAYIRLQEAETLFEAGYYNGAAYLCGYSVEQGLKASICRHLDLERYPAPGQYKGVFAVHDLEQLLFLAGLRSRLDEHKGVKENWSIALPWKPDIRYKPAGGVSREEALDVLNAIRDPQSGALKWIEQYW